MAALLLALLLGVSFPLSAQQANGSKQEEPTYQELQAKLVEREQALAAWLFTPEFEITPEVLADVEKLNREIGESYYRNLAQRSGMLVFLVRQRMLLQSDASRGLELSKQLLEESRQDRLKNQRRRVGNILFWSSLGAGIATLASSYALWFAGDLLDQRYLAATSGEQAALLKAWSVLCNRASYAFAGVGALSLGLSVPVLASRHLP